MRHRSALLLSLVCLLAAPPACRRPDRSGDDAGIGGDGDVIPGPGPGSGDWSAITSAIDQSPYGDLTVVIGDKSGIRYSHSKGASSLDNNTIIWSASKWVTSTMLMKRVEAGSMALADHPQQYIDWWVAGSDARRLDLTLEQLLSFTSGFKSPESLLAQCGFSASSSYLDCARRIYKNSLLPGGADQGGLTFAPGTRFAYGGEHMHIAGLMAMNQQSVASFNDVFGAFKRDTGLFPSAGSLFKTPSLENPMPSGGLHTSAREYAEFLRRHLTRTLLAGVSYDAMYRDHTHSPAVSIDSSPVRDAYQASDGVSEDWHYGLGVWIECPRATWSDDCAINPTYSSPGAKGFYPWIDYQHGYFGLVATDQHNPPRTAIKLIRPLRPQIEKLVAGL